MPHPFVFSLLGGALIGLSAASLLLLNGRIAGVSGILAGALWPERADFGWRLLFVAGLVFGGAAVAFTSAVPFVADQARSPWVLVAAGLLVGFGTRLGNGCTSGHGVCGVARLSRCSLVAVVTFVAVGMLTATVSHALGLSR
jgi:uncharacterized membrane protein YedE/YeeE